MNCILCPSLIGEISNSEVTCQSLYQSNETVYLKLTHNVPWHMCNNQYLRDTLNPHQIKHIQYTSVNAFTCCTNLFKLLHSILKRLAYNQTHCFCFTFCFNLNISCRFSINMMIFFLKQIRKYIYRFWCQNGAILLLPFWLNIQSRIFPEKHSP
jgi:hypothetical protein